MGVGVSEGVGVLIGVLEGVGVSEGVGVLVGVLEGVGVSVGVLEGVSVSVGVGRICRSSCFRGGVAWRGRRRIRGRNRSCGEGHFL